MDRSIIPQSCKVKQDASGHCRSNPGADQAMDRKRYRDHGSADLDPIMQGRRKLGDAVTGQRDRAQVSQFTQAPAPPWKHRPAGTHGQSAGGRGCRRNLYPWTADMGSTTCSPYRYSTSATRADGSPPVSRRSRPHPR